MKHFFKCSAKLKTNSKNTWIAKDSQKEIKLQKKRIQSKYQKVLEPYFG